MRRILLLMALLLTTMAIGIGHAGTESTYCNQCEYVNPASNKFCNKCGSSLVRTTEPGAKGQIVSVAGNRVVIDVGAGESIEVGDLFEVREIVETILASDTGDTLGFKREPTALIDVYEVLFEVSRGTYRQVGPRPPQIGDPIYPRNLYFKDRRIFASILLGGADLGDHAVYDETLNMTAALCAQVEYAVLPVLGLGAQFGNGGAKGENLDLINNRISLFAKAYYHSNWFSVFAKVLVGTNSGHVYDPYGTPGLEDEDFNGSQVEGGIGLRVAIGSRFALLAEYSLGAMTLPSNSSFFGESLGSTSRIQIGCSVALFGSGIRTTQ